MKILMSLNFNLTDTCGHFIESYFLITLYSAGSVMTIRTC